VVSLLTWIDRNDKKIFQYFNSYFENELINKIMLFITNLGGAVFTIGITILMLLKSKYSYQALEGAVALTLSHVIVSFLKKMCLRPRPYQVIKNAKLLCKPLKDFSFPSGHTTAAFALSISWSPNFVNLAPFLFILATLVGLSRVYLGMHYPFDTIIGAVIGTTSAIISMYII
jgi:undecaprenyl-diphosphatase